LSLLALGCASTSVVIWSPRSRNLGESQHYPNTCRNEQMIDTCTIPLLQIEYPYGRRLSSPKLHYTTPASKPSYHHTIIPFTINNPNAHGTHYATKTKAQNNSIHNYPFLILKRYHPSPSLPMRFPQSHQEPLSLGRFVPVPSLSSN
jgi:hypothetical protein